MNSCLRLLALALGAAALFEACTPSMAQQTDAAADSPFRDGGTADAACSPTEPCATGFYCRRSVCGAPSASIVPCASGSYPQEGDPCDLGSGWVCRAASCTQGCGVDMHCRDGRWHEESSCRDYFVDGGGGIACGTTPLCWAQCGSMP